MHHVFFVSHTDSRAGRLSCVIYAYGIRGLLAIVGTCGSRVFTLKINKDGQKRQRKAHEAERAALTPTAFTWSSSIWDLLLQRYMTCKVQWSV